MHQNTRIIFARQLYRASNYVDYLRLNLNDQDLRECPKLKKNCILYLFIMAFGSRS
jgi:hypothetical protein